MSEDWLRDLGTRFGWTSEDFFRAAQLACAGLAETDADDIRQDVAKALGLRLRSGVPPSITSKKELNDYVFVALLNRRRRFLKQRGKDLKRVARLEPEDLSGGTKLTRDRILKVSGGKPTDLTEQEKKLVLGLLPDDKRRYREYMRLHLDGLTGEEIAEMLATSGPTTSRRLKESLAILRKRILADDFELHSSDGQP